MTVTRDDHGPCCRRWACSGSVGALAAARSTSGGHALEALRALVEASLAELWKDAGLGLKSLDDEVGAVNLDEVEFRGAIIRYR